MLKCQFIIAYTERLVINFLNGAYIHNERYEKAKRDLLPAANTQPARSHTVLVLTSSHELNPSHSTHTEKPSRHALIPL